MDCILIYLIEFSIKSYTYSQIFSEMENLVCERTSFGGVRGPFLEISLCNCADRDILLPPSMSAWFMK